MMFQCWCHGYDLNYCPVLDGDEPPPAEEWEEWNCPRCGGELEHHRKYSTCATIPAEYLSRPWSETGGNIDAFF